MNLSILACPRDHAALDFRSEESLICREGHVYPIVDGIPVLLLYDVEQSIDLAQASIRRALKQAGSIDERNPALYLESLGVSEFEKGLAAELARFSCTKIDPAVSVLIAATNGVAYKNLVGALSEYPIPLLRLPPGGGKLLLDIGCSWGRWSIAAARNGYRVVGIDPSLGAIMAARRVARQLKVSIEYVCADARYLPFCKNTFDSIFSYSVIQHLGKADAVRTLEGVRRILKPSGECLIQMPNRLGLRSAYNLARRGFADGSGFDVRYWKIDELKETFERSIGPSEISVHCYFGLGLEATDAYLMPWYVKVAIRMSEYLRQLSLRAPFLINFADSVYVSSIKQAQ